MPGWLWIELVRNEPQGHRLQTLDCVPRVAPHPGAGEHRGTWPVPGAGGIKGERVLAEAEVAGQCVHQGGVLGGGAPTWPGKGGQERVQPFAFWAAAEDMKPVADLQIFQLAKECIELVQCNSRFFVGSDAAVALEPRRASLFEDRH